MGYSNSKWRKILIILSIINLCFILFARFSKVFATAPSTFYTLPVTTGNPIELKENANLIPIQYTGSDYVLYNIFCNGAGSISSTSLKGTGVLVTTTPGATLNLKVVNTTSGYSKIRVTCSEPCYITTVSVDGGDGNSWQTFYDNRVSSFSNTTFPTLSATASYDFTFYNNAITKQYLSENITQMFAYSDNSYIDYYNHSNELIDSVSPFYAPHFQNISEIEGSTFSDVIISRGDYSYNDYLYFHLLEITYVISDTNPTAYYYSDKIFALNKDSKYYYTYRGDTDNQYSYYAIPRSALGLNPNSSYLYVLTNSQEGFNNSSGILQEDESNGIYDVIQSDTTGVITSDDSINDKIQNIDDTINDNTVSGDTETDIEDSLNFNNQNEGLNNLNNGFFSRLTTMLSNLLGYNLGEDTSVSLPVPNTNKSIVLHSIDIYNNVTGALRLIINAFWVYIFTFYMWKFINKIYIAVSTGNILDTFSSSGEAITNDML